MEKGIILRVMDVTKKFGEFKAIDGVTLSIKEGELVSIIGPNGAGKTTLVNVISGKLRPDGGKVIFMGKDITKKPPHEIVRMGLVRTFQIVNLFWSLTVYENILVPLLAFAKEMSEHQAEYLLKLFGLEEYKDMQVSKLSHGVQRIVQIAVAVALRPKLLILDEPTSGLNINEREIIINIIKQISKETTILIIEHDMDIVFSISKRILVMHRGRVVAEGTPDEIAKNELVKEIYLGETWT